jgi:hypothetical protein
LAHGIEEHRPGNRQSCSLFGTRRVSASNTICPAFANLIADEPEDSAILATYNVQVYGMTSMRITLAAIGLFAALVAPAAGQNPRERRDLTANPPPPQPRPGQTIETLAPSPWGTVNTPVPQPQWGTPGSAGWTGVATPPAQPRR